MDFIICEHKGGLYLCGYELSKNAKFKYFVETSLILYNDTSRAFEVYKNDALLYPFHDISYNLSSLRELTPIKITNVYYGVSNDKKYKISKDKDQSTYSKYKIKKINKRILNALLGDKLCLMGHKLFTDKVIFTADSVEAAKRIFKKFIKDETVSGLLNTHIKKDYSSNFSNYYNNRYFTLYYQAFDPTLKKPIAQNLKITDQQLFGKKLKTLEIQPYNTAFENKFYLVLSRFPKENFTLELFEEMLSNLNLKKFDSLLYLYNLDIYIHPYSAYVYELNPFINIDKRKVECPVIDELFDDKKSYLNYLRDNRYYVVGEMKYRMSKIPKYLSNKNVKYSRLKNKKEGKFWTK